MVLAVVGALTMRGWFIEDRMPPGDFAGYVAMVDYVRESVLRYGRVPIWCTKWFAGSTQFMSPLKELATLPLALAVGPLAATKLMFLLTRVGAALATYAVFVHLFRAPAAGLLAGYAFAFGALANHQTHHLDGAFSYALAPLLLLAAVAVLGRRTWQSAALLGFLAACQLCINYVHAMSWGLVFLVLLVLRPPAADDVPVRPGGLAAPLTVAGVVFLLFAGSQLAWFAADLGNHALLPAAEREMEVQQLVEPSPLLFVNRGNWLAGWLETHHPPGLRVDVSDPVAERRYLGLVLLATCVAGWIGVRGRPGLRQWYRTFGLVFLLQYWLALGPHTPLAHLVAILGGPAPAARGLVPALYAAAGVSLALAVLVRRRAARGTSPGTRGAAAPLLLAVGVVLAILPVSAFDAARTVLPPLRSLRSPGHFFDLAPFALACLFGVTLVAVEERLRNPSVRVAVAAGVLGLLVLDFWPSTGVFRAGAPMAPLREMSQALSRLPGEDGSLRIGGLPWWPVDWPRLSLAIMSSPAGGAWSWLSWQAAPHWAPYMRASVVADMVASRGDQAAPALGAIARQRYFLTGEPERRLVRLPAPWRIRAETETFALWEQPDVMPMAYASPAWIVSAGGTDDGIPARVAEAFSRHALLLSADTRLADVAAEAVEGAALVRLESADAIADPASRSLGERFAAKLVAGEAAARWTDVLARLPVASLLPVVYRRPAPEHITLELDAGARPAAAFVSEAHHPWWRARVDGGAGAVLRAQGTFMAVPVGPGRHVVDLELVPPPGVRVADAITRLAWIGLVLAVPVAVLARRLRGAR